MAKFPAALKHRPIPEFWVTRMFKVDVDGFVVRTGRIYRGAVVRTEPERVTTTSDNDGRPVVSIKGRTYSVGRIAYFLQTGVDPGNGVVDHADGNAWNNSIENLRVCTSPPPSSPNIGQGRYWKQIENAASSKTFRMANYWKILGYGR